MNYPDISTSNLGMRTDRPPLWTPSSQRKLSRLYLYTTLPIQKIVEIVHAKTPSTAPGKDSANKKLNALLDREPRWLHPRTEEDMGRRLNALNLPSPSQLVSQPGGVGSQLPAQNHEPELTEKSHSRLNHVLAGYSPSYINAVERLIKEDGVHEENPDSSLQSSLDPLSALTRWLDDEDAPPCLPSRPFFMPSDFLSADLLPKHIPPCFLNAGEQINKTCLCLIRAEIATSVFISYDGITDLGQNILQDGLAGVDLTITDDFGNTALHFIAARGTYSRLLEAISYEECRPILNSRNAAGQTFLHALDKSLYFDHKTLQALLRVLSDEGFDIRATDHYGRSFPHLLCSESVSPSGLGPVTSLIPNLFDHIRRDAFNMPNIEPGIRGTIKAQYAGTVDQCQSTAMSNSYGIMSCPAADPAVQHMDGSNGLHCLAKAYLGDLRTLRDVPFNRDITQLSNAWQKPCLEAVEVLLDAGVNPNHYDLDGNTPLMAFAALLPDDGDYIYVSKVLQCLINNGAEVNARNRRGETALHVAARCGRKLVIRTLVQSGANVHVRDAAGRSVLETLDVKSLEWGSRDIKRYIGLEACRAYLSGKGMAVKSPTIKQEWRIIEDSLDPLEGLPSSEGIHTYKGLNRTEIGTIFTSSSLPGVPRADPTETSNPPSSSSEESSYFAWSIREVTEWFVLAIAQEIQPDIDCSAASHLSVKHALPYIKLALNRTDKCVDNKVKCAELLHELSRDISHQVQERILASDQGLDKTSLDKVLAKDSTSISSISSINSADIDTRLTGVQIDTPKQTTDIDPRALREFTTQQPFTQIISTIEKLLQQYHSPKMSFIRRLTSLSLRRCRRNHDLDEERLSATFMIDWDLREFLKNNYQAGLRQKLDSIIAVIGGISNASLCSVQEYFKFCWTLYHDDLLLAINESLLGKGVSTTATQKGHQLVVDESMRTITVRGNEEFVVTIAQQIAWLAAACTEKQNQLTYAYVGMEEQCSQASETPVFAIDVKLGAALIQTTSDGCWRNLIGPAILIQGFPIPDREPEMKGLEVSIPVMAALAGTPKAVSFGGGFVFKGRHHALVPMRQVNSAIQWHVLDRYPRKLEWEEIDESCPNRLRGMTLNDDLWGSRSFFGWCPHVLEFLGTEKFAYTSVKYSQASIMSRMPQMDKIVFGFSQWVTLTADISLGKKDGVLHQRPDDYESTLNDARSIQVILHDTFHKRAIQTNAEDLLLNLVLHRKIVSDGGPQRAQNDNAEDILDFANADRRIRSTQQVMISNAEKAICTRRQFSRPEPEIRRFKNEVNSLYCTIDGLWAHDHVQGSGSRPLKPGADVRQSVEGWEYMDILEDSRWMSPKVTNLKKSSGGWHEYAKDIRALVLFGDNFGDLLKPESSIGICSAFATLPKESYYLAVKVDTLQYLFHRQGSSEDQKKLTDSGLTLQGDKKLFQPCAGGSLDGNHCASDHLVRLVGQAKITQRHCTIPLAKDGAVIIGRARRATFSWIPSIDQMLR